MNNQLRPSVSPESSFLRIQSQKILLATALASSFGCQVQEAIAPKIKVESPEEKRPAEAPNKTEIERKPQDAYKRELQKRAVEQKADDLESTDRARYKYPRKSREEYLKEARELLHH